MLVFLIALCWGCPEQGMGCMENRREAWCRSGFSLNKEQGRVHYLRVQQGCFYLCSPPSSPIARRIHESGFKAGTGFALFWFSAFPYRYYPSGSFWILETTVRLPQAYWSTECCSPWTPRPVPSAFFTSSSLMWATRRATSRGWDRIASLTSRLKAELAVARVTTSNLKEQWQENAAYTGLRFLFYFFFKEEMRTSRAANFSDAAVSWGASLKLKSVTPQPEKCPWFQYITRMAQPCAKVSCCTTAAHPSLMPFCFTEIKWAALLILQKYARLFFSFFPSYCFKFFDVPGYREQSARSRPYTSSTFWSIPWRRSHGSRMEEGNNLVCLADRGFAGGICFYFYQGNVFGT